MFRTIFAKTLYDKRLFIWGWGIGAGALFALTAAFFPSIKDTMADVFRAVPPAMQNLLGEVSNYQTYPGYIGSAVYGLRAEMLFIPLAIILGLGLWVSEERSGKLYQLLAHPVSRLSVTLQKWFAGVIIIAGIAVISCAAVIAVTLLIGETVPYELLLKISGMLLLFGVALFTITYGISLATGSRALAMFVPIVWVMGSLIVEAFSGMVDWLERFEPVSMLTYFKTSSLVDNPIDFHHVIVLAGITLVSLVIGIVIFINRDLREDS